jgi:hypothetical protein
MDACRRIVSIGHAARKTAGIRTRQPLASAVVDAPNLSAAAQEFATAHRAVIEDELNVKAVTLALGSPGEGWVSHEDRGITVRIDTRLTPELEAEGIAREVCRQLNGMRKKAGLKVEDRIRVRWHADPKAAAAIRTWSSWLSGEVLAVSFEEDPSPEGLEPLEVPGSEARAALARA